MIADNSADFGVMTPVNTTNPIEDVPETPDLEVSFNPRPAEDNTCSMVKKLVNQQMEKERKNMREELEKDFAGRIKRS